MAFQCPKSVFISGATRGIGLEWVRQLLAGDPAPEHLFATHRSALGSASTEKLEELASRHKNLHLVKLDVTDEASIERAAQIVADVVKENGLNLLINNSGMGGASSCLADLSTESLLALYHVNAVGPIILLKFMQPLLKKAAVVNEAHDMGIHRAAAMHVTSAMGSVTKSVAALRKDGYRASKAALNMLVHMSATDLLPQGIVSVLVHPGWVQTDMGGKDAPLTPQESVACLMQRLQDLNETHSGQFLNYTGDILPW